MWNKILITLTFVLTALILVILVVSIIQVMNSYNHFNDKLNRKLPPCIYKFPITEDLTFAELQTYITKEDGGQIQNSNFSGSQSTTIRKITTSIDIKEHKLKLKIVYDQNTEVPLSGTYTLTLERQASEATDPMGLAADVYVLVDDTTKYKFNFVKLLSDKFKLDLPSALLPKSEWFTNDIPMTGLGTLFSATCEL
jgi:hypothetical protein